MNILKRFLLNLPFAGKVVVLFVILAISLALLMVAIISALYHQRDAQKWAIHTEEVLLSAEQFQRYLVETVGASRGYQLSSTESSFDIITDRKEKIESEKQRLLKLVNDNPTQSRSVQQIIEKADRLVSLVNIDELKSRSLKLAEVNLQQSLILNDLRSSFAEFTQIEDRLSTERIKGLIKSFERAIIVMFLGAIAWFTIAFLVAVVFSRVTSSRLRLLKRSMQQFAETPRLDSIEFLSEGKDEIGELASEFRKLLFALEERARESETFVYSVSHDMRSPLVNLQGFSAELNTGLELLKSALDKKIKDPEIKAELNRIIINDCVQSSNFVSNSTKRLAQIIDSLLQLSRAGRIEPKIQNIDLKKLVTEIAKSLQGSGHGKSAEFVIKDLPQLKSDFLAVQQIFQNLLSNSTKYLSPNRSGRIEIYADENEPNSSYHVLKVRDNGRGIPEQFYNKLFMPFQRYHTDVKEGDGMGLALVLRLVRRLGGEVTVSSVVDNFTEFKIRIPKERSSMPVADHMPEVA